jgi:hypothetical protein
VMQTGYTGVLARTDGPASCWMFRLSSPDTSKTGLSGKIWRELRERVRFKPWLFLRVVKVVERTMNGCEREP